MAVGTLQYGVAAPDILGLTIINVVVGGSTTITKQALMNSVPEYNQEQNYALSSIKFSGYNNSNQLLVSDVDTPNTLARIINAGDRVYAFGSDFINEVVTAGTLTSGGLIVQGVQVGASVIKYQAKAANPSNVESEYSTVEGRILINVVAPTNLPPSFVGNGEQEVFNLALTTIQSSLFLTGYTDPENDLPYKVKILSLPPQGQLLYNNIPVTINQEIPILDVSSGLLKYSLNTSETDGTYPFDFAVSDMGSQQFTE